MRPIAKVLDPIIVQDAVGELRDNPGCHGMQVGIIYANPGGNQDTGIDSATELKAHVANLSEEEVTRHLDNLDTIKQRVTGMTVQYLISRYGKVNMATMIQHLDIWMVLGSPKKITERLKAIEFGNLTAVIDAYCTTTKSLATPEYIGWEAVAFKKHPDWTVDSVC